MGSAPSKPKDTKLQPFREPTMRRNIPEKTNLDKSADSDAGDVNDDVTGENPNIDDEIRRLGTPCSTISMNFKRAAYGGVYNAKLYRNDENECRIRGAEFLPNGNLLLCDQNNYNIKLFSEKFQYLNHLKFPAKPYDLCIHSTDIEGSDVYVTLPSLRKIIHLGVEDKDIVIGDSILTDGWCYGIAPYSGGLVVCVGSKVEIMDTAGVVIKTVQYDCDGATIFGSPFYVSVTPYDELLISDTVKMCVVCINWEGDELFRYDMADSPHGIACNKDGSVFVCAGTGRQTSDVVHQLLADGSAVTIMLHWRHVGFVPDCVCYRPSDKLLLLAGQNNRIKTFMTDTKKTWKRNPGSRTSGSNLTLNSIARPGTKPETDSARRNMTIQEFQTGTKPPGYESRQENRSRPTNIITINTRNEANQGDNTVIESEQDQENLDEETENESGINTSPQRHDYGYDTIFEEDIEQDDMETDIGRSPKYIPPQERIRRSYTHKRRTQTPGIQTTENMRYIPGFPALAESPDFTDNDDLNRDQTLADVLTLRDNTEIKDPPNKFVAIGSWKNYSGWKINDPYR